MDNKYKELKDIVLKQEELLRFKHFTNQDALELGNFIIEEAKRQNIEMATAIYKPNGAILFHHLMKGSNMSNQKWMKRKFNTVCLTEHCSLLQFLSKHFNNKDEKYQGLSDMEYVFCGGGFPVILESGEFVGVVTVSNLPHLDDHKFLVTCLGKWLNKENTPNNIEL